MSNEPRQSEVFQSILNRVILPMYPGPENKEYNAFYREIVTRCVADVAGMLQTGKDKAEKKFAEGKDAEEPVNKLETKPGAELEGIYDKLKKQYPEDHSARDLILNNLHGFVKGQVHTPHPTEVFSNKAIEAEEQLVAELLKNPNLFQLENGVKPDRDALSDERYRKLHDALVNLSGRIHEPLEKPLTIDDEILRSIRFSQRQFDSVPDIAHAILKATHTTSRSLSYEQLEQFNGLIEPHTWSPGDQDSKPDMTAEMLLRGANMNRRAMMFHYYRELTVLGANSESHADISDATRHDIQRIMYKLLKTGSEVAGKPIHITDRLAEERLRGASGTGHIELQDSFNERYYPYADNIFFNDPKKGFKANIGQFSNETAYGSYEDFLGDLRDLRNSKGMAAIKNEKYPGLNAIDTLIIQTMNFKESALRVQIRQNGEMHQGVMDTLFDLPAVKKAFPCPETEDARKNFHSGDKTATGIQALLARFIEDPQFADTVKQSVDSHLKTVKKQIDAVDKEFPDQLAILTKNLSEKAHKDVQPTDDQKKALRNNLIDNESKGVNIGPGRDNYNFYQTMESLGLAAQNPDKIPKYLIAECSSKNDMLEAFFLLKVMEQLRAPDEKRKVEIVNLVEYPNLVKEIDGHIAAVDMTVGAMQNDYFRNHHLGIKTGKNLLEDYSLADGKKHLTVADVKRSYGYKLREDGSDEKRNIEGVKMMMGAGSDVTKAGSVAAAAVMMDAVTKTREALLNMEHPILLQDYIGCGGGIHRTQPVSTSFETVQGRSMRQSPENIAQKIIGLLTNHLFHKLAMNPEPGKQGEQGYFLNRHLTNAERKQTIRVNLGNMLNLPAQQGVWDEVTKPRTYAMVDKYNALYNSPEFNALVINHSAKNFVSLTQYAARPPKREGKVEDVHSMRAIGFGASLNAAGVCAPMFFGGSDYLEGDKNLKSAENQERLRNIYLADPKAQDTINRMTYGIIMSDMNVAWKYMGRDTAPDASELGKIARGEMSKSFSDPQAAQCLAQIHIEYNKVANGLLKLHQSVIGVRQSDILDGGKAAEQLLKILPAALREQLAISRENIREPRQHLADLFKDMSKTSGTPGAVNPKSINRDSKQYKELIYPAMGAVYECFEHAPRAYTRPKWVKATEHVQQEGRAA